MKAWMDEGRDASIRPSGGEEAAVLALGGADLRLKALSGHSDSLRL